MKQLRKLRLTCRTLEAGWSMDTMPGTSGPCSGMGRAMRPAACTTAWDMVMNMMPPGT